VSSIVIKPGLTKLALIRFVASGVVLMSNKDQNQITLWNPWRDKFGSLSVEVVGGLQGPHAIHWDASRDRLYVGEWNSGRVLVIDNIRHSLESWV
jgi:hypothetical protein